MPNSSGRSRLANTTRAPEDLPVSCTYTMIRAPSPSWLDVFTKAPWRLTTIVSPSQDDPVASTSIRTRIGTRVLRRRSLCCSGFAIVIALLRCTERMSRGEANVDAVDEVNHKQNKNEGMIRVHTLCVALLSNSNGASAGVAA